MPILAGLPAVGFCLSLISAAAAHDHQASPAEDVPTVEVQVANDLFTLHVEGVALAEVLRASGEAGSFRVVLLAI